MEAYPWDSKQFRFLGSPIDGIQFEEDKIVLVEFKSSSSQISVKQRKIKELVEQRKVEFELIETMSPQYTNNRYIEKVCGDAIKLRALKVATKKLFNLLKIRNFGLPYS